MTPHAQGLTNVARLVFSFARVKRVTLYDDGVTYESDTDHTVMLSVCACALAQKFYPYLDVGKVAQFAIVHDLVEAYAGDTNTFNIKEEARREKEKREAQALVRIQQEFQNSYSWIPTTIEKYEALNTDEAQFVKAVDKLMTKLTHCINQGAYLKMTGKTKEETKMHYDSQTKVIEDAYGEKFPEIVDLLKEFTSTILRETYPEEN